jgi:hypothetical protein
MKILCGQIYIEPGVSFPFSSAAIRYLDEGLSGLVTPSDEFVRNYGSDFKLVFNISAKKSLEKYEVRGPTVFKRTKDVEYTLFLPFTVIVASQNPPYSALRFLFQGIYTVFHSLGIDASNVADKEESIIKHICSDPTMFRRKLLDSDKGPPIWTASQR